MPEREAARRIGRRMAIGAVAFVVVVAGSIVGLRTVADRGTCKGVGISVIGDGQPPKGEPTPEAALAKFAPYAQDGPAPADGWEQAGPSTWVREMGDGRFYQVGVRDLGDGWVVSGESSICRRRPPPR